ncbi:hypothetical protein BVY01_00255, partial [bacterium I07]
SGIITVEQARFTLGTEGILSSTGLKQGLVKGGGTLAGLVLQPNDTTTIKVADAEFGMQSELDSLFLPEKGKLRASINDLFKTRLNAELSWETDPKRRHLAMSRILKGQIEVDSLFLSSIPGMPPDIDGYFKMNSNLSAHGVDDIHLHFEFKCPGIDYKFEDENQRSPELTLSTSAYVHGDTTLQSWTVDSAFVNCDQLMEGRLHANAVMADGAVSMLFELEEAVLHNRFIPDYFPEGLKEEIGELILDGDEKLQLTITAEQTPDTLLLNLSGKASVNLGVELPEQLMAISGVQGDLSLNGDPMNLKGDGHLLIGQTVMKNIREEPYKEARVQLDWHFLSMDSLFVENGMLSMSSLGVDGNFSAAVKHFQTEPVISALARVGISASEPLFPVPDLSFQGDCDLSIRAETLDAGRMRCDGIITIDSLDISGDTLFTVNTMSGNIPFQIDFDTQKGELLSDSDVRAPNLNDYLKFRRLYSAMPETGSLSVRQIDVMGYHLDDFGMDLTIMKGTVQIPWFYVNVLDGNVGGAMSVNLGTGDPSKISYRIQGQAARINSAALLSSSSQEEEETELNATLAFDGRGIDITKSLDCDGFFHITKI